MPTKETAHPGFYIPNAGDVIASPRMAEPDRVDFSTLAHPLWGVIEGCEVSVAGTTATTAGGTLLVNGNLVTLAAGTVSLGVASTLDRFVLVVADAGGVLTVIVGAASVDPVFPDVPLSNTVLAAVFCPTSVSNLSENVIDKRKFVNKALLTKIAPGEHLIRNLNGSGNHFLVNGGGEIEWENDTWLWRSAVGTLSVRSNLSVDNSIQAGGTVSAGGNISTAGSVQGANLRWETAAPVAPQTPGTIWQNKSNGKVFVWNDGAWKELATVAAGIPVGTVINSVELPSVMMPLGWIPLDGRRIYESDYPALFSVAGLAHLIGSDGSRRYIQLPQAQGLTMIVDWDHAPAVRVSPHIGNRITLTVDQMPKHAHNPISYPAGAANPTVSLTHAGTHSHYVAGGSHNHATIEEPHAHHGMDLGGTGIGAAVIALMWGGTNKIDALFNDRNHTYSVEAFEWSMPAVTNVRISNQWSEHVHYVDDNGEHTHIATVDSIGTHVHAVAEDLIGGDGFFDITPEHLTVFSYIRS